MLSVQETGFTAAHTVVNSSQDVEYETGNRAWKPVEILRTVWDAVPVSDMFNLQALTRTAVEEIPGAARVRMHLRSKKDYDVVYFSSSTWVVRCLFTSLLSAGVKTFNQGKVGPVIIRFTLTGTPAQQDEPALCVRQQITHMQAILTSKLRPKIEGAMFGSGDDLAEAVADVAHSAKPDLAKHLVVRSLKVETASCPEADITTPDQHGNAARGEHEELENPADESDDHDSGFRGSVPVEMSAKSDDNARHDLQREASSTTAHGETQAATLKRLMQELDAQLSSPSPSLPAQATPASPPTSPIDATTPTRGEMKRGVVVALGSNVGNRIEEIEKACRAIDADPDMCIVDTSFLYETKPMYVEDQERFVNGACEVSET